jgi:predicted RNase H-like HicB family nuclease
MLTVEVDREEDGRFIAEIPELPGVMAYGGTLEEAVRNAQDLALRVIADRVQHGEHTPFDVSGVFHISP